MEEFNDACHKCYFKNDNDSIDRDTCIFVNKQYIFELNFKSSVVKKVYKLQNPFCDAPLMMISNCE